MTAPDWWADAACRDQPAHLFFPPSGNPHASYNKARVFCQMCSVRVECLDTAMRLEIPGEARHGMWGGRTPRERDRIARNRRLWHRFGLTTRPATPFRPTR